MIFGTYQIPKDLVSKTVYLAIKIGFRHIDTAELYNNQIQVGEGINRAINEGIITRNELFVTTKVSKQSLIKKKVSKSINKSLRQLNIGYIDCVLLHCPIYYQENWDLLKHFQYENKNKVKNIGVSNFSIFQLKNIFKDSETMPFMNQIEINPNFVRDELIKFCNKNCIKVTAHSITAKKEMLKIMKYSDIINEVSKTGVEIIVTSSNPIHIVENFNLSKNSYTTNLKPFYEKEYVKYPKFFSADFSSLKL